MLEENNLDVNLIDTKRLDGRITKEDVLNHIEKKIIDTVNDFRKQSDQEALWTNSMFSGMPAYQISTKYKANLVQYVDKILNSSSNIAKPS